MAAWPDRLPQQECLKSKHSGPHTFLKSGQTINSNMSKQEKILSKLKYIIY
jgi:hypothetical protein